VTGLKQERGKIPNDRQRNSKPKHERKGTKLTKRTTLRNKRGEIGCN